MRHLRSQHDTDSIEVLLNIFGGRVYDTGSLHYEYDGIDWPRIWTMERDRQVWDQLQN